MSVDLVCVDPNNTADLWGVASKHLEMGWAAGDEYMPEEMLEWLAEGKVLLWLGVVDGRITAALATMLVHRLSGLTCKMLGAGGSDLENFKTWHERIEEYARAEGCVKIECECRDGWLRALEGYKRARSVIVKELRA